MLTYIKNKKQSLIKRLVPQNTWPKPWTKSTIYLSFQKWVLPFLIISLCYLPTTNMFIIIVITLKLGNSRGSLLKNFEHKIHFTTTITIIQTNNYCLTLSKIIKRTIQVLTFTNQVQKRLVEIQKEGKVNLKDTHNHLTWKLVYQPKKKANNNIKNNLAERIVRLITGWIHLDFIAEKSK